MASLRSVSQHIDEYASLSRQLFGTLETLADDRRAGDHEDPRALVERIVALDRVLQNEVDQIEEHQRWQQRILEVEATIEACDRAAERLVRTLHRAKMTLEDTVDAASQQIADADARAPLDYRDVLAYAKRLAPYTSAPPRFDPANPSHAFEKPFPDEQMMRAGRLGQLEAAAAAAAAEPSAQTATAGGASAAASAALAKSAAAMMQGALASAVGFGMPAGGAGAVSAAGTDAGHAMDDLLDLDLNPDLS
ncbi:vitamin-D-receptor interacting mediator subunit 4-domain-containing protein [Thamnocephalis sphaerospora]|uniref:Mediator of RNA polymerase II transcription subunit 4 n=1 Tax=Thamnocephalis sphaerospora TaxID=78915 RepID=A0A4P9XKH2_9FUNG|nr:vitamin-D-receptor interacting mediator subunit 4-domain-containing protein [Thamnocephalis sphaerospora]|eukprot:RKP06304.1 vitamin-D-receptor interacting mediator subunit 4-domain-containing protein [Thamnocephalis sphaerospora]